MIQEAYVSHEVAKLLKEKGFNELCQKEYYANGFLIDCGKNYDVYSNSQLGENEYSAPTQQIVMRWLREEYKIDITVDPHNVCDMWIYQYHLCKNKKYLFSKDVDESYEICVEEAIKYCLENLI